MSLGDNTQCDLSADIAKLDITALNSQLEYHFFSLVRQIHEITAEIGYVIKDKDREDQIALTSCHKSKTLQRLTKQLAITAELSHTIQKSFSRDIKPINLL